jgi:serine/threonine protein kinase
MREFMVEIASLGRLRHRTLVELRGWCKRELRHRSTTSCPTAAWTRTCSSPAPPLAWDRRVGILRGVAAGLAHVHEECEQAVVHRDVKASNVLLGAVPSTAQTCGCSATSSSCCFCEKSTSASRACTTTTRVVGTLGYMSPEIVQTGRGTNVFAFGVLVLEVACGRRPIAAVTGVHLLRWVRELGIKGEMVHDVDERLEGRYDTEAKLVLWLGLMCSHMRPDARPRMRQVCQYLDGKFEVQEEATSSVTRTETSGRWRR